MTAPDMESIIAAALEEHWRAHVDIAGDDIRFVCECGAVELVKGSGHSSTTTWSRAHQARAVLGALGEAGNVEWGTETVHEKTGDVLDRDVWQEEQSARLVAKKFGDRLVSRVVTAWTAVEG